MVETIEDKRVLAHLVSYFEMLKKTGYVNSKITGRFLLYLFLYDFVESLYDYFYEEDYNQVNTLLLKVFSDGGCLLPYKSISACDSSVAKPSISKDVLEGLTQEEKDDLLRMLLSGHGKATIGNHRYNGRMVRRVSEQTETNRVSEEGIQRIK